jgi:hypothetical protein
MNTGIYYVGDAILQTVWLEEKAGGSVSSFVSTVMLNCIAVNETNTVKHHTEIDYRLVASILL